MIQYQFQLQSTNFFQQISDNPESRYSTNNVISSIPIIQTKAKLFKLSNQFQNASKICNIPKCGLMQTQCQTLILDTNKS